MKRLAKWLTLAELAKRPATHYRLFFKTTFFTAFFNKNLHFHSTFCTSMDDVFPSLKIGSKKLGQVTELSVPAVARPLLNIRIVEEHGKSNSSTTGNNAAALWQCGAPIPTAFGPQLCAQVVRNECVTRCRLADEGGQIGKAKWELELELSADDQQQQQQWRVLLENCDAGDSFNVLFENPGQEVDFVLKRLGFCAETADDILELHVRSKSNGKFAYFPARCTPRQLLSQFIDIRRAPSRLALRIFADHAHEPTERRRLFELCSAQGSMEFTKFVRQPNISLVELLCTFPSLTPPLACLMECLPRLVPRHYTLTCYLPAQQKQHQRLRLRFVYSVLQMPPSATVLDDDNCTEFGANGQQRYGACTQWLLQQRLGQTVQLVQKEPSKFRFLPPSLVPLSPAPSLLQHNAAHMELLLNTPLMMVGPGTGVAPFIAFLQKIRHFMQIMGGDCARFGGKQVNRVLFYASSNLDDEFLFRSELEQMVADGVLSELVLCESRPQIADHDDDAVTTTTTTTTSVAAVDTGDGAACRRRRPRRVYDALRQRSAEIAHFLMAAYAAAAADDGDTTSSGLFYACGDVKNMSRELWACLSDILEREKGLTVDEAFVLLKKLREKERLIEDVWS